MTQRRFVLLDRDGTIIIERHYLSDPCQDGATVRLFINGVQVASTAITGTISTSTGPLRIGGNSLWGEYFQGSIDEMRIYNRALTQAELQTDMTTPIN